MRDLIDRQGLSTTTVGKRQRAVLVVSKRNVTRKFKTCTQKLKLGQDVANKRERKGTVAHNVAKSYPLYQTGSNAVVMVLLLA